VAQCATCPQCLLQQSYELDLVARSLVTSEAQRTCHTLNTWIQCFFTFRPWRWVGNQG
jgi:hypothetical protein